MTDREGDRDMQDESQLALFHRVAASTVAVVEPHPGTIPTDDPNVVSEGTIQRQFEEYDRQNPEVYAKLRDLALHYRRLGYARIGMKHLVEILRWNSRITTTDPHSPFKIANAYTSR